ncbi:MAG TPA: PDZ domain-containing protein, partial [Desulfobacterales bacterium]|nr:PDZ domain-containing protein [Desulfobacterales bacterium]
GKKKKFLVEIGRMKEEGERLGSPAESMELGMLVKELTPSLARRFDIAEEEAALVVVSVEKGSPAEEAGLRPGDLILEVDQQTVKDLDTFNRLISKYKRGDVILFLVKRQGSTIYLTLKVWE